MPANKANLNAPHKDKSSNGFCAGASKKKKRSCVKHKKQCRQYLQLHSEYRSTYTWHEYTGPHQEHAVVRRAPQPPASTNQVNAKLQSAKSTEDENSEGPTLEPPLPRRKKCPELAYKTHEFINAADGGGIDAVDSNVVADKVRVINAESNLPASQLSKAISRISTEYRLQFAWPKRPQLANGEAVAPVAPAGGVGGAAGPPRKSLSMGALKQGIAPSAPAPVHKKRLGDVDHKRDGVQASELEPLVRGNGMDAMDGIVLEADEREEDLAELKVAFRGKRSENKTVRITDRNDIKPSKVQEVPFPVTEVAELRRLAYEYKHRDWGCGLTAEDEASLWKRVSSNHVLDALSLARSVTKEEKEKENTRKVAPVSAAASMPPAGRPSSVQARPTHGVLQDDIKADSDKAIAHARKEFLIRHHLDRTTGIGDGALLPSPTREKLEPVIPRRRDDTKETREEVPSKTKSSPKSSPRTGRSQSLGPSIVERRSPKRQPSRAPSVTKDAKEKDKEAKEKEKEPRERSREPERHPRPTMSGRVRWSIREPSSAYPALSTNEPPIPPLPPPPSGPGPSLLHKRSPQTHRKSSLATTAPPHRPLHHAKPVTTVKPLVKHSVHSTVTHPSTTSATTAAAAAATAAKLERVKHCAQIQGQNQAQAKMAGPTATAAASASPKSSSDMQNANRTTAAQAMTAEPLINGDITGGDSSIASTPPSQTATPIITNAATATSPWVDDEPVVKSPPEPTRVKSPEQMIMRSPEPVNWTVPLDTGKTFTVTQNVREGEPLTRPHSEAKTWAPSSVSSAPQSAPPELAAQHKSQLSGYKSPESESVSLGSFSGLNGHKDLDSERDSPLPTNIEGTPLQSDKIPVSVEEEIKEQRSEPVIKPVTGTNLRCLEDPVFEFDKKKETALPTSVAPQQGYRVLEAESPQGIQGVSQSGSGSSGYHVLEAPAISPGSAQRSVATDVLEKARNRFDKFWGKGGSEN